MLNANLSDGTGATPSIGQLPSHIYITGASGYIGRNLVRYFVAAGVKVTGLVRSASGVSLLQAEGADAQTGDILTSDLAKQMAGCDAVIHAAADTDHGLGSDSQTRTNVEGTRQVFEAARRAGVRTVIHISSESVLADGEPLINVNETRAYPCRPAGSYSKSKQEAEMIALSFASEAMRVIVVRPRMVWGRDDTTALPMLVSMATSGQLRWIDGGMYKTSTLHIANLCHGVALALAKGRNGEIYFLADGEPSPFRSFVTEVLATQGVEAPTGTVPRSLVRWIAKAGGAVARLTAGKFTPPLTLQAYAASAVEITLDTTKARNELGYRPVMSREDGMAELRDRKAVATRQTATQNGAQTT